MAVREQFADDRGADEASGTRDEDAHVMFSQVNERAMCNGAPSC
jgi:hypothetical protein